MPERGAGGDRRRAPAAPWVFFASREQRASLREVLPRGIAASGDPVLLVRRPQGPWRDPRALLPGAPAPRGGPREHRPVHWPTRPALLAPMAARLRRACLRAAVSRLAPGGPGVVCFDAPEQACLAPVFAGWLRIYLAVDDLTLTVDGIPIAGEARAERRLLAAAHGVVCVSPALARRLAARAGGDAPAIEVLGNGFDPGLFRPGAGAGPEPDGLRGVARPRVLVAGLISGRIDWDGIAAARRRRPEWQWVLLGPGDAGPWRRDLPAAVRAGIHCRGPVAHERVPAWLAHCDAAAVPYRLNAFTRTSMPLKAVEALAQGREVLATRAAGLARLERVVHWVEEGDGPSYAAALDGARRAAGGPERARRLADAVSAWSWPSRVEGFRAFVGRLAATPARGRGGARTASGLAS